MLPQVKERGGEVSFECSCVNHTEYLEGDNARESVRGEQAETVSVENSPGVRQAEGGEQAGDGGSWGSFGLGRKELVERQVEDTDINEKAQQKRWNP